MADDRPLEDPTDAIGRLTADLDDLRSTVLARLLIRPTGDIEPTIRSTAKAGTLLLKGQTVSRTTYAGLWAWAQEQGLVIAGLFTVGDGLTTFGLPNMAGRVPVGVGTLGSDTYALGGTGGTALRTLTTNELPAHTHTGSGSTGSYSHSHGSAGSHSHSGSSSGGGGHGGHNSGSFGVAAGGDGAVAGNGNTFNGDHSHSMSINSSGDHTHSSDNHSHSVTVTVASTGSGAAFDQRQPWIAINWAIWV